MPGLPNIGNGNAATALPAPAEDVIELPNQNQMQTLYNGEPMGLTPIFAADTPVWNGENQATAAAGAVHRKSSDGTTLRFITDALGGSNGMMSAPPPAVRFDDTRDPLDTSSRRSSIAMSMPPPPQPGLGTTVSESPFGTLVVPPPTDAVETTISPTVEDPKAVTPHATFRSRRSTTIKPNWSQTPRILVVEDDVVYRQLSSKFLEKFGCVTETVENAQGAVDKMNNTKYDLVLMDIFFGPNMDGRKATSLIRQFDNYTPIISMTSNAQPQDVDSYFRSGMNDILAKPFTKHNLYLILDKHLVHLRHVQIYERLIPMSVGVPPLSDQHVVEALSVTAANVQQQQQAIAAEGLVGADGTLILGDEMRNPLAGSGWSDETYSLVLSQYMSTGMLPDVNTISDGSIGTSVVFSEATAFNDRKRSLEAINDDDWATQVQTQLPMGMQLQASMVGLIPAQAPVQTQAQAQIQELPQVMATNGMLDGREAKRARGMTGP